MSIINFNQYIGTIVSILLFLLSLIVIWNYRKWKIETKLFGLYIIFSTIMQIASYAFAQQGIPNLFFFHINTLAEFIIISTFFKYSFEALGDTFVNNKIIILGALLIIINSCLLQRLDEFNSFSATVVSLFILVYAIRLMGSIIESNKEENRVTSIKLLKFLAISLLLEHGTSLIVLLFSNELLDIPKNKQLIIWTMRSMMLLTAKIVLLYAFIHYIIENKFNRVHYE